MNCSPRLVAILAGAWMLSVGETPAFCQANPPMAYGKPLKYWTDSLKDPEVLVRQEAILVLGDIGPAAADAVPDLTKLLKEPSLPVRVKAATALIRIDRRQAKNAVPVLCEGIKQGSPTERYLTIQLLGQIGPDAKDSSAALVEAFGGTDVSVRNAAIVAVNQIGEAAVPALKEALGHKNALMRQTAADALRRLGPRAKDAATDLIARLHDEDGLTRVSVARALYAIDPHTDAAIPALSAAMQDKDLLVRRAASTTLVSMRPLPKDAVPIIVASLKNDDAAIRVQSAKAVWQSNHKADEIMPVLLPIVRDPKDHVSVMSPQRTTLYQTLLILNEMGPEAKAAVPPLLELLKSQDYQSYSFEVARTLGAIGAAAVPPLAELLDRKNEPTDLRETYIRNMAIEALSRAGPDGAGPLVKTLDRVTDVGVRRHIISSLGQMGPAAKDAVPKLVELAKGADANFRRSMLDTLGRIGPEARPALPFLLDSLNDPNPLVVSQASQAFRTIHPDPKIAVPALLAALKGAKPEKRANYINVIIILDDENKALASVLIELLKDKQDGWQTGGAYLSSTGPHAKMAVPDLVKLLNTPGHPGRLAIINCLNHMGPNARAAVPDLLSVLKTDKDAAIRSNALGALNSIHADTKEVAAAMLPVFETKSPNLADQYNALDILGACGKEAKDLVPTLVAALQHSDVTYRLKAAQALAKVDADQAKEKATPMLEEMLTQAPAANTPVLAALLATDHDNQKAWVVVRDGLRVSDSILDGLGDPTQSNRLAILTALESVGPAAKKGLPDIKEALKDPAMNVRIKAAQSLW